MKFELQGQLLAVIDVDFADRCFARGLSATCSMVGISILHGAHHSAQKSIRTTPLAVKLSKLGVDGLQFGHGGLRDFGG